MTGGFGTTLADQLAALMLDRELDATQLAKRAGVVRNTVVNILEGRTERSKVRTLRSLAVGLARHGQTGEVDRAYQERAERLLLVAARHVAPDDDVTRTGLGLLLAYRLASRERARAWQAAIDALEHLTADEIVELPRAVAAWLERPG